MPSAPQLLVVDDQPELLDGLTVTLEIAGYQVRTATDGDEALDLLRLQPFDLVLADIAMPHLNGYQLYEQIRANPAWSTMPVIFLSARALESDVRYGKALGVDDYLTKPIKPEDLLAAVRGKLRRAAQLTAQATARTQTPPSSQPEAPLQLLPGRTLLTPGGQRVRLSVREARVLDYLIQHAARPIPPSELARVSHDLDLDEVEAGSLVRPLIRSLRRKLGYGAGEMGCVANIHGLGYQFSADALLGTLRQ